MNTFQSPGFNSGGSVVSSSNVIRQSTSGNNGAIQNQPLGGGLQTPMKSIFEQADRRGFGAPSTTATSNQPINIFAIGSGGQGSHVTNQPTSTATGFGGFNQPATKPITNIFGQSQQPSQTGTTGFFGNQPKPIGPLGSSQSVFGAPNPSQQPQGGLFGSSSVNSSLFKPAETAVNDTSRALKQNVQKPPQPTGTGLFGAQMVQQGITIRFNTHQQQASRPPPRSSHEVFEQEFLNMPNGVPLRGFQELTKQRADEIIRSLKG